MYRISIIKVFLISLMTLNAMNVAFSAEKEKSIQEYIELGISQQKPDPNAANRALEKAFSLAKQQNNQVLIPKILLEQAQVAKIKKDYFLAQQLLSKAELKVTEFDTPEVHVHILINMSSIQRYLKHYDRSLEYIQKALSLAREERLNLYIFRALQVKGTLLKVMKRWEGAVSTYLSAQRYIASATVTEHARLYKDIASSYSRINELQSSLRYFNKSIQVYEENNQQKNIAKILIEVAKTEIKMGRFSEGLVNAKRSLQLASEFDNEKDLLKSLVVLSIIYRKLSSYEDALKHGLEALKIYQKNNDLNGIAASANAVGLIYIHLEQYANASSYFKVVIDLPEKKIKTKYRASALRDLGKLIYMESQASQGLSYSNEAFTLFEKKGDRKGVATVQKNLGYIYYQMGNDEEAKLAYKTSIDLFHLLSDVWNEAETKAQLAMMLSVKDVELANKLAQESLNQALDISAQSIVEQAYSVLIITEEKRKNFQQALHYAKKKAEVINEIKADAINKRLAEIHIILAIEKKERAFEQLKREKERIVFELEEQERSTILEERDEQIKQLNAQKNMITIAIILFILGGIYFKMQYRFIIPASIIILFLLFSGNSYSRDIIKLAQAESELDVRQQYPLAVLKEALMQSKEKYGEFQVEHLNEFLNNKQKLMEVRDGDRINLIMAMTSPDWEYLTIPIRIPIRRGIANYRLLVINQKYAKHFDHVQTLVDLKAFSIGIQKEWILNGIIEGEGFNIVEGLSYDAMFRMLNRMRFDYIPRGINEAYSEISLRKDELKDLMIEPRLALYIPQPYYIFVSPKHPELAERVTYGLEKMITQGILQKMFEEHYGDFIKQADLANRTIIQVGNKHLTQKTPFDRKELWFNFDLENE